MQETDNFEKIFDGSPVITSESIIVEENKKDAKIRHLNIKGSGIAFYGLKENFSDRVGNLFKKTSLCKKNADEIILFESKGVKCLMLCEMKSSCGAVGDNAFQQVFASYMKMCMLLSLCDGFDISNFRVLFIFTARRDANFLIRLNELQELGINHLEPREKINFDLLSGKFVNLRLNKVVTNTPFLNQNYLQKEITCKLLTSENEIVDFDVNSLYN